MGVQTRPLCFVNTFKEEELVNVEDDLESVEIWIGTILSRRFSHTKGRENVVEPREWFRADLFPINHGNKER
jgi:hypothetical protein